MQNVPYVPHSATYSLLSQKRFLSLEPLRLTTMSKESQGPAAVLYLHQPKRQKAAQGGIPTMSPIPPAQETDRAVSSHTLSVILPPKLGSDKAETEQDPQLHSLSADFLVSSRSENCPVSYS